MNAWAWQLRQAGVAGSMDELRARAYLDLLLNRDSRPAADSQADGTGTGDRDGDGTDGPEDPGGAQAHGPGDSGSAGGPGNWPGGPGGGLIPAGFAGKINLTIPATALLDLAGARRDLGAGPGRPQTQSKYIRLLPIPGASRPGAEGMAHVVCRRASFPHEGLPRKRRGTPGMAVTRESMNSRQACGGGSA